MTETPPTSVAYLDHAATTPMLAEVVEAMSAQLSRLGNASSLHGSGRAARRTVEESRETLAAALGARPSEVVFTSGGTESDNLAIKGIYRARHRADPRRTRVLTTTVEHHAVLDPVQWLGTDAGAQVELVPVDRGGRVDLAALRTSIARDPESVALVSIMWANNEVGTLQPVAEVAAVAAEFAIPVHTDAVQACGQVPVDFAAAGVDAMTVTGHKIGGPFGVGALVVRRELDVVPLLHGGGQERDIRSGTLDVPAVVGFARAAELVAKTRCEHAAHLEGLRDRMIDGIAAAVPDAVLNGPRGQERLPGNVHFSFPGCEGDSLLMLLDAQGIECSTGSACSAGVPQPSHVLLAMGRDEALARGSLRFTLGRTSTESDVDRLLAALPPAVERARAAGITSIGAADSGGGHV